MVVAIAPKLYTGEMTRFIFYAIAGFAVAGAIMYVMARQMGLDPFAPNVRTISSLSLVAAAYVGIRIAMIVRALERRGKGEHGADARRGPSTFQKWGRNSELDARMQARRERVRRARERSKTDEG